MRLALHAALGRAHIVFLDCEQKTVVHKIKSPHELYILLDLLLNLVNITSLELNEVLNLLLFVAFHSLQIDIFQRARRLDFGCHFYFSVYD